MLLTKRHLLFIHIPKTGGNSIQNLLAPFSEDEKIMLGHHQDGYERFDIKNRNYPKLTKHSSLTEYRASYPASLFESLNKMTVVRNTFDRVISYYFSPHRGDVKWDRDRFIEFLPEVKPIQYYIALPGQQLLEAVENIDWLLRFEDIRSGFASFAKQNALPQDMPHVNKSPLELKHELYDEELIEIVTDRFKEEVDFFGFNL